MFEDGQVLQLVPWRHPRNWFKPMLLVLGRRANGGAQWEGIRERSRYAACSAGPSMVRPVSPVAQGFPMPSYFLLKGQHSALSSLTHQTLSVFPALAQIMARAFLGRQMQHCLETTQQARRFLSPSTASIHVSTYWLPDAVMKSNRCS